MAELAEKIDPFEEFESAAELLAFWAHKHGEQGFRELLDCSIGQPVPATPSWQLTHEERMAITTRDQVESYARDLQAHGLRKLAKIVREVAAGRPREVDLPPYQPGSVDHRDWLLKMKRQGKG